MSLATPFLLSLLPAPIAHQLLPHLSTYLPFLFPPSPRGSATYQRNFRNAVTIIIVGYIVWSFRWGDTESGEGTGSQARGDWYSLLGVGLGAGDEDLKRAFRTLSRTYHPDRAGPSAGPAAAEHFIRIRQAYEGLSDPVKRWAYDRFGPDVVHWKVITVREYMRFGINQSSGFYLVSGGIMLLLSLLGRAKDGAFWRHLLFFLLLITELHLVLVGNPKSSPTLSSRTLPSRLLSFSTGISPPFLQIRLLHRIFASLSVGISQLAGVWSGDGGSGREPKLDDVLAAVHGLHTEAIAGFHDTVAPLLSRGDPQQTELLIKNGMEEVLVDRAISTHPQIRPLWLDALQRAEADRSTALSHTPTHPEKETYPSPPPYLDIYVDHSRFAMEKRVLGVAVGIPLPPSPPPSPRLGPRR